MKQSDLAQKQHWDAVYNKFKENFDPVWVPRGYEELALDHALEKEISKSNPKRILEIGCGNSAWLPYLGRKFNVEVFGMDYSADGCELARKRLAAADVAGTVFCKDLFAVGPEEIGAYDFVYSLGVVEHFADLEDVLGHMLKLVRPGGVLFTEVPNLRSVHGLLMWLYQPEILNKHRVIGRRELEDAYEKLRLQVTESKYLGIASIGIVSWGFSPRIVELDNAVVWVVKKINAVFQLITKRIRIYSGMSPFSPFLYVVGTNKQNRSEDSLVS